MKPSVDARELAQLRRRIERLRRQGLMPIEAIMAPETWERLKQQYRATLFGMAPKVISARDVLGIRNKLVGNAQGVVIRYFGGADHPPEKAVEDGSRDLARMKVVPSGARGRSA